MRRIIAIALSVLVPAALAAAQPAKPPYEPGLGEFMTATQLRHAKLVDCRKGNELGARRL